MRQNTRLHICQQAQRLLRESNIVEPPVNVEAIAARLGIIIRRTPTTDDVSGFLLKQAEAAVIGVNSLHHPNRQRFTIAHEIGHYMLHDFDEVHVDKSVVRLRSEASSAGTDKEEVEANRFAAELLMPKEFLEPELSRFALNDLFDERGMQQLARHFQVSVQAMSNRLTSLGYIAPAELG
jgi:Zn-dependent peptidase ImmA (M78 family)